MNLNNQKSEQKTRALGYTVAVELTDQEMHEVSGGVGDPSWSTDCGGRCTATDDVAK